MSDILELMLEQSVLTMILKNNNNYDKISRLEVYHFRNESHQIIFKEIKNILEAGHPANILTLSGILSNKGISNEYLKELVATAISDDNINKYIEMIIDNYNKNELIKLSRDIEKKITEGLSSNEIIDNISSDIFKLSVNQNTEKTFSLEETFTAISKKLQVTDFSGKVWTGFHQLDNIIGDLKPGNLTILGGRPSVGKTSLATCMAINIAAQGHGVLFISMEMTYEQIGIKILSSLSGVGVGNIMSQNLHGDSLNRCLDAINLFQKYKIFIHDTSQLNIGGLKQLLRFFKRNYNIKTIFIDYLQLMKSGKKLENMREEIGEVTRGLKLMAKELLVSIVALCQLSREIDKTGSPLLSHLSGSARLEQEADTVIALIREEDEADKKRVGVHIIKNRNGRDGSCKLLFEGATSTFKDIN